jgi:C4-dicarboxylate transporter, DctM subunit
MKDVSLGVMFRGVIPFCISSLVVAVLIIIFPSIATWLPELMK